MEPARNKTVARAAEPAPAPAAHPVRTAVPPGSVQLQSALKVSSPSDPAEKEAESTAKKIARMPTPEPAVRPPLQSPYIARFRNAAATIARKAEGMPNVSSNVAAEISASTASGSPLPASVRRFMEPRFRTDFGNVRVHTNERSARLNRQLNAQAFTVGNQIFFGRDRFRPETQEGRELVAHELTHTIQQGAVVQRSAEVPVTQQSPPSVQRLGISDALDYFADRANLIPGFRMFTIILGVNPINMSRVERSAANILRAVIEFIPGGALITQALDNHGVFDRVGAWVEQQINTLGMTGSVIRQAIDRFLDSLSWTDIFDLGGLWDRARRIFSEPIDRIFSFVRGLVTGIIRFIKDAILRPLARLAEGTRGYDLLKAVLGQDPITGEPYPRNAETLIGGFMKLIGQEEIWQNIQRSGAVARAWAWFQGALSGLMGFVRQIPSLFVQAFQSLEIADIVLLPRAFARIASVFGGFIGQFFSWAGNTVWSLLEIIFSVVAPGVMVYLRRAAGAFRTILRNPIGFVGNLVRAGLLGLRQFATNFLTHLRASLVGWLTGAMSGANIYIPQAFTLREIIKFVLSVLGLTWQNIRQKLVRAIGETAVRALETGFDIVMTLVTQGPAAAWEKIQESLTNLREMIIEQVMTFVRDRVVQAAITRLVTSLNPAGAFIQAVIAIYNTVMFFVERLRQIAQVAASFIDSISAIASGVVAAAANRVEQTMAGLLTLVISFLARIAGLGRVSDAVIGVVNRVRQPIDRALDRVVEWIVAQARRLGRLVIGAGTPADPQERLRLGMQAALVAVNALGGRFAAPLLNSTLAAVKVRYGFQLLEAFRRNERWWIRGAVNPRTEQPIPEATDEEIRLLENGQLSVDERKALLTAARGALSNEGVITKMLDLIRRQNIQKNRIIPLLDQVRGLPNGYTLTTHQEARRGGVRLRFAYHGLYFEGNAFRIGHVGMNGPVNSAAAAVGFAEAKAISADPDGNIPTLALSLDFLVPPEIENAGIRGVGTEMFRRSTEHFRTRETGGAVAGQWYRNSAYARGGRPDMSRNLIEYLEARRGNASKEDAARATWTYRQVSALFGGVPLEVTVNEQIRDINNVREGEGVVVLMRPA